MTGQLYGKDIVFESDVRLKGAITASGTVKFKNDSRITIDYQPASPAITELFWPGSLNAAP